MSVTVTVEAGRVLLLCCQMGLCKLDRDRIRYSDRRLSLDLRLRVCLGLRLGVCLGLNEGDRLGLATSITLGIITTVRNLIWPVRLPRLVLFREMRLRRNRKMNEGQSPKALYEPREKHCVVRWARRDERGK